MSLSSPIRDSTNLLPSSEYNMAETPASGGVGSHPGHCRQEEVTLKVRRHALPSGSDPSSLLSTIGQSAGFNLLRIVFEVLKNLVDCLNGFIDPGEGDDDKCLVKSELVRIDLPQILLHLSCFHT